MIKDYHDIPDTIIQHSVVDRGNRHYYFDKYLFIEDNKVYEVEMPRPRNEDIGIEDFLYDYPEHRELECYEMKPITKTVTEWERK